MPGTKFGVMFCLARFAVQDKSLMLLTQGLERQPFHGNIVLLVNEFTNSAGEMVAQFAKDTKLATVIGQKTMGNVLGSTTFNAGNGYTLYMPVVGWYSPNGSYTSTVQPAVSTCGGSRSLVLSTEAVLCGLSLEALLSLCSSFLVAQAILYSSDDPDRNETEAMSEG